MGSEGRGHAILLFLAALAIRGLVILATGFDGLYGQDAYAYYDQAVAIARSLPRGELPPLDFYWPNGYPLAAALFMWPLGARPVAAQLISLLSGAALAPLTYVLTRDLFPQAPARAAVIAGTIVVSTSQAVVTSVTVMADAITLVWLGLAAWLTARAWSGRDGRWQITASGAALAMAIATRYLSAVLIPVLGLYGLVHARGIVHWLRRSAAPLAVGALIVVPQVWLSSFRPEALSQHPWVLGWHPLNAFRASFETPDGFATYVAPVGLFYAQILVHPAYFLPPTGLFVLWGAALAWRARAWPSLLLLLGWPAAFYLFLAGVPYANLRFGSAMWMPLVVFAGLGFADALDRPRWRRWTAVVLACSLAATLAWSVRSVNRIASAQRARDEIARAVERRLPAGATLVTFGLTLTARHVTSLDVVELFHEDPGSLAGRAAARPFYLLVDLDNLARQWHGHPPDRNYVYVRDGLQISRLGDYAPYTLFEVTAR